MTFIFYGNQRKGYFCLLSCIALFSNHGPLREVQGLSLAEVLVSFCPHFFFHLAHICNIIGRDLICLSATPDMFEKGSYSPL